MLKMFIRPVCFPAKKNKNESDSREKHTRTCSHTTGCDGFISFGVICVAWCIGPQHCLITANLLRRSESMLSVRSSESASSFSLPVHELSAFTCWILCFSFSSPIGGTRGYNSLPGLQWGAFSRNGGAATAERRELWLLRHSSLLRFQSLWA